MKKLTILASLPALVLAGLILVSAGGCKKQEGPPAQAKPPKPAAAAPVEKTSFEEVTSQLDAGGNFYLYLGTEQFLQGLSGKVSGWRELLGSIPDIKSEDRANLEKAFDVLTGLIKESGLEDVSGFGLSTIARAPGFYRSKMLVHHYPDKGSGFLWDLFGQKPHALEGLSLLSTNAAIATFSDLDVPLLWSVIQKQIGHSGIPQAEEFLNNLPGGFEKATGLKWNQVLGSLGGEFGFVLTLNDAKKISIPMPGGEALEIPEPGLLLIARVKDDTIFNRVDELLKKSGQQIVRSDKPNLKMRTMPLALPLPIQLRPSIATSEGYLLLASNDALIEEALAVKAGGQPGLKSTQEFQSLAKEIPNEGNQFTFMSQRFGQAVWGLQQQALLMSDKTPAAAKEFLKSILSSKQAASTYTVGEHTEQGWLTIANGNQNPATFLVAATAIAPIGLLSAIAIPNFVKARQTAQRNACINNLRQIDGAKQQWALENNKKDSDTPARTDLLGYFPNHRFPQCPTGGRYTLNAVADRPECSAPGHILER